MALEITDKHVMELWKKITVKRNMPAESQPINNTEEQRIASSIDRTFKKAMSIFAKPTISQNQKDILERDVSATLDYILINSDPEIIEILSTEAEFARLKKKILEKISKE